jgi:hypothetical protein
MGDFGQVGTASLWKSGPFFSTGTSVAELKVMELRLNLRSLRSGIRTASRATKQLKDGMDLAPSCPQHLQSPAGCLPQEKGHASTGQDGRDAGRPASSRRKGGMR